MSNRSLARRRSRRGGFTLMEVLLVLAILVILGSLVAMSFKNVLTDSDKNAAKSQISLFETPINLYWSNVKQYPQTLDALITAPADVDPAKWKGPYMDKAIPKDPWGGDYKLKSPGTHNPNGVDIWSAGPDQADGTEDDVGNW